MPEFDSQASSQDDNPFASPRKPAAGRISGKLNFTKGFPTHSTDTSELCKDQFMKVPQSQKCYDVYSEKKDFSNSKVHYW